ncbi:hypothetical protein [Sphaerisporangium sp. NPDC051011]|uniref:hypothetical protein n=1 Tax=Sphaerisporangium sp. NPDC051011 TaxID=3155792 RepID=UPI0033FF5F43
MSTPPDERLRRLPAPPTCDVLLGHGIGTFDERLAGGDRTASFGWHVHFSTLGERSPAPPTSHAVLAFA